MTKYSLRCAQLTETVTHCYARLPHRTDQIFDVFVSFAADVAIAALLDAGPLQVKASPPPPAVAEAGKVGKKGKKAKPALPTAFVAAPTPTAPAHTIVVHDAAPSTPAPSAPAPSVTEPVSQSSTSTPSSAGTTASGAVEAGNTLVLSPIAQSICEYGEQTCALLHDTRPS